MLQSTAILFCLLLGVFGGGRLAAAELEVQKVTDGVYAIVGAIGQRAPDNLGNNATLGFIVTNDGVVLIDSGGSYKGAQQIHRAVKGVTDKPVRIVINTGGQDHRWLGNGYFKEQGARIIAAEAAVADQKSRVHAQLSLLNRLVGEQGMAGTRPVHADETFDSRFELIVGGVNLQLYNPGTAHTPGDTYVWLPEQGVVFSGDIVYVERMLAVGSVSNSRSWIQAFDAMAALGPVHVVPGHGHPTDLEQARADTYDYLVALRQGVADLLDRGFGLESLSEIDQSRFDYLKFYEDLKGPNAHAVFLEMEWE
ncbi:MAG: MBL fold metallo-hydrolase [Gammaproteobacteria bacterium]|nr:MBL fold metallo-hydrolase [Gammaproteobacteria bacterium]NIT64648.1 MBL fold metallo-hydrolase [Gammaproteobacteria bacterium]NIV21621.1 MBL fold metallo-hydrolase [Gammaproteobacteria bacterium]NIY33228.1 MBL fold metallo-hydrolase [Gammaproteobacteria bacterium]